MSRYFYIFFSLFMLMTVGTKPIGLMSDSKCFAILGCNVGFFGYDALTHFIGGITIAVGVAWLAERYPHAKLFGPSRLRNFLTIIAIAALIGVCWEILEFGYDHFRMYVLHMDLFHPNQAAQPSNSDTMGDLSLGLLGAFLATIPILKYKQRYDE